MSKSDCLDIPTEDYPWITWTQFTWIIGILIVICATAIGFINYSFAESNNKQDEKINLIEKDVVDLKVLVPAINANLNNLDRSLQELKTGLGIKITIPQ